MRDLRPGLRFLPLLLVISTIVTAQAGPVRVLTEESPPFSYTAGGRLTGAAAETVREILRRLGEPDSIVSLPWAQGYHQLQTEPNVALFSTTRTAERENQFQWVGPLFTVRFGFYARRGSGIRIASLEDARRVQAIATYQQDVKEQLLLALHFTNLDRSTNPTDCLRKLLDGRVDLWLFDNLGVLQVAREAGLDPEGIELVFPFRDYASYIAFSPGTPAEVALRWQVLLDGMKRDGSYSAINRRWLPGESLTPDQGGMLNGLAIYTEDAPPASYLAGGRPEGFAVELVREVLRRTGQPDTIELRPWAHAYHLLQGPDRVALFPTARLPAREARFKWAGPLFTANWIFYGRKGDGLHIASLEDARAVRRIGVYKDDAREEYLRQQGFGNLVSSNRDTVNARRLAEGDIDLWASSDLQMAQIASQAGVEPALLEPLFTFHRTDNFVAFSSATPDEAVRAWQAALEALHSDRAASRRSGHAEGGRR
jgi:polar amino acid transport system substrate-binding protein